jgi:predicted HAD superfamily phosphohydrolase YqeG
MGQTMSLFHTCKSGMRSVLVHSVSEARITVRTMFLRNVEPRMVNAILRRVEGR